MQPVDRNRDEVSAFLDQNEEWILDQLQRVERLRKIRVTDRRRLARFFFAASARQFASKGRTQRSREAISSVLVDGEIVVRRGSGSQTPVARSLENWLRRQARADIEKQLTLRHGDGFDSAPGGYT